MLSMRAIECCIMLPVYDSSGAMGNTELAVDCLGE